MIKNLPRELSAQAVVLGILIPPSIMLIVYSVIAQLSPLRLFAAAIFPGLMLAGLYILYAITRAYLNPSLAPKPPAEEIPPRAVILKRSSGIIFTIVLFNYTSSRYNSWRFSYSCGSSCSRSLRVFSTIFFIKHLNGKNFKESVFLTAKTTAMIMWLFIGSWTFASVFSYLGGHEYLNISLNL